MKDFIKAFKRGMEIDRKCHHMNFFQAVISQFNWIFRIMGPSLYIKYHNGTAVEGVDFFTAE